MYLSNQFSSSLKQLHPARLTVNGERLIVVDGDGKGARLGGIIH
jgi:hypothetical protein